VSVGIPAHALAFSPDGAHLAVGSVGGAVKVVEVGAGARVRAELLLRGCDDDQCATVLRYSPQGAYLAVGGGGGSVGVYDVGEK